MIILVVSMFVASALFFISLSNFSSQEGDKVVNSNEFYVLKGKPTQLQKDLFDQLSAQIDQGIQYDFKVIDLVVQSFVADYYTWSNKNATYDVGGLNFIYGDEYLNFYRTSRKYFYDDMMIYINKGLKYSDLQEVETITTRNVNFASNYEYYDKSLLAFYVEVDWTYKENLKIDTSVFPNYAAFTLIVTEEGRYEIVRFY